MGSDLAVGVIGLGFGANHARVLNEMQGVRLAALCDTNEERLTANAHGREAHTYTHVREMFRHESLDAVIVAVPARLHEPVALAAIEARCAVLVEKPLAPTLDAGMRIVEAAERASVSLMAAVIERYNPAIQEVVRRVRAGDVGRVIQVNARRLAYFVPRARDVDVGVIQDLAYHDIDIMRYVLGAEVTRVYAETHAQTITPYDDAVSGLLRFRGADGHAGAIGHLEVHWLSPRKVRELDVLGDQGLLVASYSDFRNATLEFQRAQSLVETPLLEQAEGAPVHVLGHEPDATQRIPLSTREPLEHELSAFTAAVRNRAPMPVSSADALATLAIADALAESARTGLPVKPAR